MANEIITIENLKEFKAKMLSAIYPVGSVYISFSDTSPASLFGGTWTQLSNTFLYATDENAGKTGGSRFETLTVDQMPEHQHGMFQANPSTEDLKSPSSYVAYQGYIPSQDDYSYQMHSAVGGDIRGTTATAGGGQPHNNMPPYVTCYMWRRTA